MRVARSITTALCVALAGTASALPPEERSWDLWITTYGWLASIDASVEAGGVSTEVDVPFSDILADLGWAAMGVVEGRWRRGLLVVDTLGMQVATDVTGPGLTRSFRATGVGPGAQLHIGEFDVHTRTTSWTLDVKPGFRVLAHELADDGRRLNVDAFLGFRYWNIDVKTNVEIDPAELRVGGMPVTLPGRLPDLDLGDVELPGTFLRGTDHAVQDEIDWFDPLVGLRVSVDVTKWGTLVASGDVGGFDIGADASDLTWQAMLGTRIRVSDHISLTTGYRALGLERGDGFIDAIMHGPQIGLLYRF